MAKQVLSNEFVSDSDSEETSYNEFRVPHFEVPKDYKKLKHLKNVPLLNNSTDKDHELWLFKVPKNLEISKMKSLPLDGNSQFQIDERVFKIELNDLETQNSSNMTILSADKNDKNNDILKILNKKNKILNFDKIFTINYTKNIPDIQYDKIKVPRKNVPKIEGLKVRHFATGYEEEEEEKVTNQKKETQQKKRKHDDIDNVELKDDKKKSKKDKKDKKDKKKKKEKKH